MTHSRQVVSFIPEHYRWLEGRHAEKLSFNPPADILADMARSGSWWTGVVDGEPIAIAGVVHYWQGRCEAHAILSTDSGPHMLWVTRRARRHLATLKGRIEMTVRRGFDAGERWAAMLGFAYESTMPKYGPDGETHFRFVRFN